MDHPVAVLPVIFAAPRIVVAFGISAYSDAVGTEPCGGRPILLE
jgi:hypothetical protein